MGTLAKAIGACTAGTLLVSVAYAAEFVPLGDLPGEDFSSQANGVSNDGSVVVGHGLVQADRGRRAFVWTQGAGMQNLQNILVANGATGLEGWVLDDANDISADGQWIVGRGTNPSGFVEPFLARIDDHVDQGFEINAGINDAWSNPDTSGHGFFITVYPDIQYMFPARNFSHKELTVA